MDSLDIEIIKKEIISKVNKLGEDYLTSSFANKLYINHAKEKRLSCHIIIYDDYFNFTIYFADRFDYFHYHLARMENMSWDRLDSMLSYFDEICKTSSKLTRNICNYIDSLPSLVVEDVKESTVPEQFNEHFGKYGVQYDRVLIDRYIGMIIIRDGSKLTVSIDDGIEKVIFCKPVNQTNYVEVFNDTDELLVDVMKNLPSDSEYFEMLKREK